MIVVRLNPRGVLYLVVDDTLLHKRGKLVYGSDVVRRYLRANGEEQASACKLNEPAAQ